MSNFPSSIPSYAGFTSSHTLATDQHASQHNAEQADVTAIATKIGTGASTPVNSTLLRGNGTGTSTWAQANLSTDVTGLLPTTNGGTGTASITGTGSVVFNTNPTITNPTETGGTYNSATLNQPTINYSNNTIPAAAIQNNSIGTGQLGTNVAFPTITSNPYKFSVYRNAAANTGNNAFATIVFDVARFDTGNNVSLSTGVFTAPVAGFYQFNARASFTSTRGIISIFKNGAEAGGLRGAITQLLQAILELQLAVFYNWWLTIQLMSELSELRL